MTTHYEPKSYWESHLGNRPGLMATGHRRFSMAYNEAMYQIATERLKLALSAAGVDLAGKSILDVGAGFGYFIQRYLEWGVSEITGVDLTDVSVRELQTAFPQHKFIQADISEPVLPLSLFYDLVSAISMIFHIVDDARFQQAVRNMCACVKPTGHLIIVDAFRPTWTPTAQHAKLRDLPAYQAILSEQGFRLVALYPMYYLMGRTFVPVIGPLLLNQTHVLKWIMALDRKMGAPPQPKPGWLNYLIAQRAT